MQVKTLSKTIAESNPNWADWPTELPTATYRYEAPPLYRSEAIKAGERLHAAFSTYTQGEWITPALYFPCQAIESALADLGVYEIHSEQFIQKGSLRGQVDLHGTLQNGRPVVIELKATLGQHALKPRPSELIQLAAYAHLLEHKNPLLVCVRVALMKQRINTYVIDDTTDIMEGLIDHPWQHNIVPTTEKRIMMA